MSIEEIVLQPGESKQFSKELFVGSEIIPLSKLMLAGKYNISGNITTSEVTNYQLDFNGSITDVHTQLFGMTYNVEVGQEPLEIYLKTLEEIDMLYFVFNIIRIE